MTSRETPTGGKTDPRETGSTVAARKRHCDEILDEALDETFPASDPIELTPKRPKKPASET